MKSLQGHLLVASPKLVDPNFFHTVVLLVQHNQEGALGLVLNRPLQTTVQEMWQEVGESQCEVDQPLHQGGPCEGRSVGRAARAADVDVAHSATYGLLRCGRVIPLHLWRGEVLPEAIRG